MDLKVTALCRKIRQNGLWTRWDEAPALGCLLVGGPDAGAFLQAQLTSDVAALQPGQQQMSARVDRKGLLLAWFSLCRLPERGRPHPVFMLVLPRELITLVQSSLESFIITEEVFLEDASGQYSGMIISGDQIESMPLQNILNFPSQLTGDSERLLLWPNNTNSDSLHTKVSDWALKHRLVHLDSSLQATQAWNSLQLEAGWPRLGHDLDPGSTVLIQTGLERQVVSITKGCYLGQEILARIRSYGSVKMAMRGLVFMNPAGHDALPESGDEICTDNGQIIGKFGTNTYSSIWDAPVALAFLDRDHRTPGRELDLKTALGSLEAKVIMLPFYEAGSPAEKARSLYERAVHLFSLGKDLQAANLLEEAIGIDPSHGDSYEALGVILGRSERYHEAIDIFHRLEEIAPDEPIVHTNLSLYYMKIGNREEAENQRALSTMKQFGVHDPEALQQQEEIGKKNKIEEARRKQTMFAEVLDMDPTDALALMGMGNALSELGEFGDAEKYLGQAINEQKDNSSLYLSHGKALEKLGRNKDAREVWKRGVEVASRRGDLMPMREMEHRLLLLG